MFSRTSLVFAPELLSFLVLARNTGGGTAR